MTEHHHVPAVHKQTSGSRRWAWPLALVVVTAIVCLALVLVVQAVMRPVDKAGEGLQSAFQQVGDAMGKGVDAGIVAAQKLASAFERTFNVQPTVTVESRVVTTAPRDLAQIVVVEQTVPVRREIEHEFLKSTKRLVAKGEFRVLAGYDLAETFEVDVDDVGGVVVRAPEPRILAVETTRVEVEGQDGLWNKISDGDRNQALADLQEEAREAAGEVLLEEARHALRRLISGLGGDWRIVWNGGLPDGLPSESSLP